MIYSLADFSIGDPLSDQAERQCVFAEESLPMDTLEYGLGKSRGWWRDLDARKDPLLYDAVRRHIVVAFSLEKTTLLPSRGILQTLLELFEYNFRCDPRRRKDVDEVLSQKVFEYDFLPPLTPNSGNLMARGAAYGPLDELPRVQSTVHPAFFIKCIFSYGVAVRNRPDLVERRKLFDRFLAYDLHSHLHNIVPWSWFGDTITCPTFSNRWPVRVRHDLHQDAKSKAKDDVHDHK